MNRYVWTLKELDKAEEDAKKRVVYFSCLRAELKKSKALAKKTKFLLHERMFLMHRKNM